MSKVIAAFDGSVRHGGLTNRLAGVISCYEIARHYNKEFGVQFTFPFELHEFLVPNKYDWTFDYSKVSSSYGKFHMIDNRNSLDELLKRLGDNSYDTYYVYSNGNLLDLFYDRLDIVDVWSKDFNDLFEPSGCLREAIGEYNLPDEYIGVHLRFLDLLGDFEDTSKKGVLPRKDRKVLIRRCRDQLMNIRAMNPGKKIFVASDSERFLDKIKDDDGIIVSGGNIRHTDLYSEGDSYMRTFVDFFMLANAERIYNIQISKMHKSWFPVYASYVYNKPFRRITV